MVKTIFKGSTIEIWEKDYINREPWMAIETRDIGAEIIQIEHAYDDYFMVEVRRVKVDDLVKTKRVLVEEDLEEQLAEEALKDVKNTRLIVDE